MKIETKFGFSRDGYRNQRALLIGINYKGSKSPLYGCQNDVLNMKKYIMDVHGFPEHNIDLLMDDGIHVNPTKSNIIDAFKKLVELSEPGDVVYVHFAGHGAYECMILRVSESRVVSITKFLHKAIHVIQTYTVRDCFCLID